MRLLLKFLYFLLFLVIAILLAGLLFPSDVKIESTRKIKSSVEIVFDQVNVLKNWENWSPWLKADTTVMLEYNEIPAGKGAEFRWVDEKSNTGSVTIVESKPEEEIHLKIDFGEQGDADIIWKFLAEEDKIKVTWIFENRDMTYFERYFMLLFKKSVQNDLDKGLEYLKKECEALRLSRTSAVEVIGLEPMPAMVIIDSSAMSDMEAKVAELFSRLKAYLDKRDVSVTGDRFAVFYSRNPEGISKFAVGYPIAEKTRGWKEYSYFELPGGKAATITHWGRYDSEKPYLAMDDYLHSHGLKQGKMIWEEYLVAPEHEPDTSLWEKRIYYPLEP